MWERYLQITEFARIAKTSRKTLQYYDELGLFRPARVGANGYRYYSIHQLDRLALIAALRDMGLPLKEIKTYLDCGGGPLLNRALEDQREQIDQRIAQLRRRKALLTSALEENRLFQSLCGAGLQVLEWAAQPAAKLAELDREGPFIVNYLTDGLRTGLCLQEEGAFLYQKRADGELVIPAGRYLCLCEQVEDAVQERSMELAEPLYAYARKHGLTLEGRFFAEFNDLLFTQADGRRYLMRLLRGRIR